MTDQVKSNNQPERMRADNITASIWKNEGERGSYYSTQISRTYKDKDGQYRNSDSFSKDDLLKVSELARAAYGRVNKLQQRDREMNQEHDSNAREAFREKRQAQQVNGQEREAPSRNY